MHLRGRELTQACQKQDGESTSGLDILSPPCNGLAYMTVLIEYSDRH